MLGMSVGSLVGGVAMLVMFFLGRYLRDRQRGRERRQRGLDVLTRPDDDAEQKGQCMFSWARSIESANLADAQEVSMWRLSMRAAWVVCVLVIVTIAASPTGPAYADEVPTTSVTLDRQQLANKLSGYADHLRARARGSAIGYYSL